MTIILETQEQVCFCGEADFGNSEGIWSQGSEGTPLGRWRLLAVSNQGEYLLQKRHIDKKDSFFSNFLYT